MKTEQWTRIGFQGTDPATDFRGMGLLGLHAILHLVTMHPDVADRVRRDPEDTYFYFYAIGGINIASKTYQ